MRWRSVRIGQGWWTTGFTGCILVLLPAAAMAQATIKPTTKTTKEQTKSTAASTSRSTLSGVFTDEQASRGKDVYAGNCKSCHTPASHTGATFAKWWRGKQLSDLYGYVSTKMPKNDPGSLAPEDAADVVAYLLKMNAMPVGKEELPPDLDSLKQVRIETAHARTTTATRKKP
jgi:mono/diheme cytochrome c family protein